MKDEIQCKDNPEILINLDECENCESRVDCLNYHYEMDYLKNGSTKNT